MDRLYRGILLFALTLFVTGCGVDRPRIPKVIAASVDTYQIEGAGGLKDHRQKYEQAVLANNETAERFWRDTMINMTRRDIEYFYREYEVRLAGTRRNFATAVDVVSFAGVTAATITNGARPKTVISSLVSFIQGAHGKLDENTFRDKTIDVIVQKMRASRTRIDTEISRKMGGMSSTEYTFAEAEKDLRELFWAGTLLNKTARGWHTQAALSSCCFSSSFTAAVTSAV